jgi:hypothetical protein
LAVGKSRLTSLPAVSTVTTSNSKVSKGGNGDVTLFGSGGNLINLGTEISTIFGSNPDFFRDFKSLMF